jgi:hypothetical protein
VLRHNVPIWFSCKLHHCQPSALHPGSGKEVGGLNVSAIIEKKEKSNIVLGVGGGN